MKRTIFIFVTAFALNFIWENAHSFLYASYMGGKITEFILFRASLVDALIITAISIPFIFYLPLRQKGKFVIPIGLVIAWYIESWALSTNRWEYNSYMPIIPFINIGLTPFIQLGLLGYISYKLISKQKTA